MVPDAEELIGLPHGEILLRACQAGYVYGSTRRASGHATAGLRATDPATHPDLTGELFMARGRARSDEGRADALEDLKAAAEYLDHDHVRRPALDAVSAIVLMRLGREDEAEWAARVAVASAQRIGDEASEVEALMTLANLLGETQAIEDDPTGQQPFTGRRRNGDSEGEAVTTMLHRAIDLAQRTGRVRMEVRAWRNLAVHLDHQMRMEEGYRAAERGWERCAELGISRSQGLGCGLAMVGFLANMGRLDEAEALLARLPRGESRQAAHRLSTEALHHTFQGRWEQAEEALADFTRIMPRDVSSPLEYLNHYYAQLYLLMYRGDLIEAAVAVEHAHDDIDMLEPGRFPCIGLSVVGELVFRLRVRGGSGELRRAEALSVPLRANLDHDGGRVSPLERLGRGVIRGFLAEDPEEALELFAEVALVAEAGLNRGTLLQALTGSFHSALRSGDPARARTFLERFESLEREASEWVLRHQAKEMRAALKEATPEPAVLPAGLTPRELEVLKEVAKGSSNREVGEALFISAKTVSVHLSNLMAKLGADNRTAAVTRGRELGLV